MISGRKMMGFLQSHKTAIILMFLFILFSTSISSAATVPTITWNNPANITYGTALSTDQLNAVASVDGTFVYIPSYDVVLSTGIRTLHVDFTPTDTANYSKVSKEVKINVNKAIPTIIWSKPADITYRTALNSTQLNAVASVDGTFVYTPQSGYVLNAGTQQKLHVDFIPSDTANYENTSKEVTINVTSKVTPTIIWSKPADITYGTALSPIQLNANAIDPVTGNNITGTFTYNPVAGTILSAGTQTLHVYFTPEDDANYNTASKDVPIEVKDLRVTPTITWNNPADITYGTELSSTQLNAVATDPVTGKIIAGNFVYTPAAGNMLSAGAHTLHAEFIPDDTKYDATSKDVIINVNKATPTVIWSNPADITISSKLSTTTELNAVAVNDKSGDVVPGTFVYTPRSGTVLSAGIHTLHTEFIPDDTKNYYSNTSKDVTINVVTYPVASFTADVTSGIAPLKVQFNDTTGDATAWHWDFGDGNASDSKNSIHVYYKPGTYNVSLEVENTFGNSKASKTYAPIHVYRVPVASFKAYPTSGDTPLTVHFDDTSRGTHGDEGEHGYDANIISWSWNFGDGTTSNEENPVHKYTAYGTYLVNLTISINSFGTSTQESTSSVTSKINVYPVPVVAKFTMDEDTGRVPHTVEFTDCSEGDPSLWHWDFGDGSTSNSQNPRHTYYEAGTYTVCETVSNTLGAEVTGTDTRVSEKRALVHVYPSPAAYFTTDVSSGLAPLTVQFTDISSGMPVYWSWDFGDGTSSHYQNPRHTYYEPGTYKVTLDVENAFGATIPKGSFLIDVYSLPEADFSCDVSSGQAPLKVQFTEKCTGNPTTWAWNFGDGTTSNHKNPVHTYIQDGIYQVTLTASNSVGTSASESRLIDVNSNDTPIDPITVVGSSSGSSSHSSHSSGKASVVSAASSPEPPSNVEAKVTDQNFVLSKNHVKFEFTRGNTPIDVVEFDAKKTLGKITTTVEKLKGRSTLTPTEPGEKVIKYLNIWVGNSGTSSPENIENAKVGLRISRNEVTKSEESSVVLQRYADGKWNSLETTKTGEDAQYVYYQARTPGFSPFAITKKNESQLNSSLQNNSLQNSTPSTETKPIEINKSRQPGLNKSIEPEVESEKTALSRGMIIICTIVFIAILLLGFIVKDKWKK